MRIRDRITSATRAEGNGNTHHERKPSSLHREG